MPTWPLLLALGVEERGVAAELDPDAVAAGVRDGVGEHREGRLAEVALGGVEGDPGVADATVRRDGACLEGVGDRGDVVEGGDLG